jgi:hypothetical protein
MDAGGVFPVLAGYRYGGISANRWRVTLRQPLSIRGLWLEPAP